MCGGCPYHTPPLPQGALLDGKLYGKVASFSNGSMWELVKDDGKTVGTDVGEGRGRGGARKDSGGEREVAGGGHLGGSGEGQQEDSGRCMGA